LWDLERAVKFARACEDCNIAWLEEPLDMYAFEDMAELRRQTTVPIAGGELTPGWHEHKIMLEKGSLDIYQPDACFCGVSTAVQIMAEVNRQNLKFKPHTWTNGIGFAINLQIAAANPNRQPLEFPYEPPAWIPRYRDGILAKPFNIDKEGFIAIPDKPGLGIEIDQEALNLYGKKFYELTPKGLAVKTIKQRGFINAMKLAWAKKRGR
jgi:D-galactarolactone cycloisomerase